MMFKVVTNWVVWRPPTSLRINVIQGHVLEKNNSDIVSWHENISSNLHPSSKFWFSQARNVLEMDFLNLASSGFVIHKNTELSFFILKNNFLLCLLETYLCPLIQKQAFVGVFKYWIGLLYFPTENPTKCPRLMNCWLFNPS